MHRRTTGSARALAIAMSCALVFGALPSQAFAEAVSEVQALPAAAEAPATGLGPVSAASESPAMELGPGSAAPEALKAPVATTAPGPVPSPQAEDLDLDQDPDPDAPVIAGDFDLSNAKVSAIEDQAYTGRAITPMPTVELESEMLWYGIDYTVSYASNTEVGTATATITGRGDYFGSQDVSFSIVPADVAEAIVVPIVARTYTGKAITPEPVVMLGTTVLRSGTDYTLSYRDNVNAGTATVTISGKGNCAGTKEVSFRIIRASLLGASVAPIAQRSYTGKAIKPKPTVKLDGKTLKAGADYTLSYRNNTKVGTATITITGKGNYRGVRTVTFQIVEAAAHVAYRAHVQTYGWQGYVRDGEMGGTQGQAKRLEALRIRLEDAPYAGGIEYCSHVQKYGWLDYVRDGAMSGTQGESKRLEAVRIRLTGKMAEHYDVWYRVHVQSIGWMGWTKNDGLAGTTGMAKRLEAVQIKLLPKGSAAPGITSDAFRQK